MQASQLWKKMVEAEHAQSERMMVGLPPQDHWRPYAQQFKADPRRTGYALVNRLLGEVKAHHTVLDVGAGGGRLALPLATRCRRVVAVEPSSSMGEALRMEESDACWKNASPMLEARWEEAEVDVADIVLCVHVLCVVAGVESFVRKLEAHAREQVLVVLFQSPPQSQTYALWERVHGEARLPLPSLPEFQEVLEQMGIDAPVELLPPQPALEFADMRQALDLLARRLYLEQGSPKMAALEQLLPDLLEERGGAWIIRGSQPMLPGLVSWQTS